MTFSQKFAVCAATPLLAIALSVSTLSAAATPAQANACELTDAELSWGVKESFRSYISGGIAHGSWETLEGANYTTPNFLFTAGTGKAAPENGGEINFAGKIHFTGHEGLLDLTMANPSIVIKDKQTAVLLLDMRSNDTSGNLAIDEKQVELANLDISNALSSDSSSLTITAAPAKLTAAGVPAFGKFYAEGADLDPVTFSVKSTAGCMGAVFGEAIAAADTTTDTSTAASAESAETVSSNPPIAVENNFPTAAVVGGSIAAAVITGAVALLVRRNKKANTHKADTSQNSQ